MLRCLHGILIIHEFTGIDFTVANVQPIHELYKLLVGISHNEVFCTFQQLVFDCTYQDRFKSTVRVIDKMIIMDIILLFLVHDDAIYVRRVDRIGRRATRFLWTDE